MMNSPDISAEVVIATTQRWLQKVVIGLNLCPFANAVHSQRRIRYAVTQASTLDELLDDLERELKMLSATDANAIETTLLIHPRMFADFLDYNEFLGRADDLIDELGFYGELQIASFHPKYQFAGTQIDDITNYTNRSPHPTLHLLRESSISAAIAACADTDDIYLKNIETMRKLGAAGWSALGVK